MVTQVHSRFVEDLLLGVQTELYFLHLCVLLKKLSHVRYYSSTTHTCHNSSHN